MLSNPQGSGGCGPQVVLSEIGGHRECTPTQTQERGLKKTILGGLWARSHRVGTVLGFSFWGSVLATPMEVDGT